MTARKPPVTLIRLSAEEDVVTFVAAHSADSLGIVAEYLGDHGPDAADTLPWDALPGIEALAAADLRGRPRRSVSALGTAVGREWTAWHLPAGPPPVPGAAAEGGAR